MDITEYMDPKVYEDEVRRIARYLWPSAQFSGAAIEGQKERDGVFVTEECVHLVEATADKKMDKAEKDAGKLCDLAKRMQLLHRDKPVQCWLVTRHEPTADQREAVKKIQAKQKRSVNCLSYSQFQGKIIDARSYIAARDEYYFGSIRDPRGGNSANQLSYVDMDILDDEKTLWSVSEICQKLSIGGKIVLLGDYGAGKSMTLREIYRLLRNSYLADHTTCFPMYINLRDHQGQKNPAEIIERHARNLGFSPSHHLVRAWNAGYAHIILDGFDEITSFGMQGKWKKLYEMRYRSMEAIRGFSQNAPTDVGVIIAGREYFFDSYSERDRALSTGSYHTLTVNDFTEEQIKKYQQAINVHSAIPKWMPSRPLLVGTLLLKGVLQNIDNRTISDPGIGWDMLIGEIAKREARIEAGIDSDTVRQIFERLATKARAKLDGVGPLSTDDVFSAFYEICGYKPDEPAMVLLLRLPGLGIDSSVEDSRKFIDEDFADACRAGDFLRYIENPFTFPINIFQDIGCVFGDVASSVASLKLDRNGTTNKKFNAAIQHADKLTGLEVLKSDFVLVACCSDFSISTHLTINDVISGHLCLDYSGDISRVCYRNCYFSRLSFIGETEDSRIPIFEDCFFAVVDGRASQSELSAQRFNDECLFDSFTDTANTTNQILSLRITRGAKVLLSILRKIYTQRGTGRLESALYRGLDTASRRIVPDILRLLSSEGFIIPYSRKGAQIWLPAKDKKPRVSKMISSPNISDDPLLLLAENTV